jgi:hypothetical protein
MLLFKGFTPPEDLIVQLIEFADKNIILNAQQKAELKQQKLEQKETLDNTPRNSFNIDEEKINDQFTGTEGKEQEQDQDLANEELYGFPPAEPIGTLYIIICSLAIIDLH